MIGASGLVDGLALGSALYRDAHYSASPPPSARIHRVAGRIRDELALADLVSTIAG